MLKRMFLNPDNMWSRVENGELLYTPIIVVSDITHTHIYLLARHLAARGRVGRLGQGPYRRAVARRPRENINIGRDMWRKPSMIVVSFDNLRYLDLSEYLPHLMLAIKYFA